MSLNLTKSNHFEFESAGTEKERKFFVKIGVPENYGQNFQPMQFAQSVADARYFADINESKKIILCLSGGVDSEAMCRAFIAAKVNFQACFLRFKNNLNMFDLKTNIDFCDANSIKYSFVDLDIIDFLESGKYFSVALKYECQSPQIATHLWFLDQIDSIPCLSGNPIVPVWQNEKWFIVGLPGELHSTYFKYFYINNREGIPWFFIYSPELIKSFFSLRCMRPYLDKKITQPSQYTYLEKCKSYLEGGFLVKPREDKFTGFELVKKYYDERHKTTHGQAFNNLFRKPLEEIFPFPDEYFQIIPKEYFDG